ncbi:transporter substrate-binding domain-containing protein [Endozoicomonas sp. SM1973]|uniref:Transporter substrate-binding domain-containing protein n=1 Tax=Spartinivicinus marinus TaxID=2994442 RepID=A0A853I7C3_9GAMM|nr:transporter substrate-binding domain-containing protein [Spartinivicinus marinus]MCX4029531.1 transporter substrate-binding domain-containing protein [Spartinivicinus marinus]NYZ65105.1 transporter substrate-binding domain-containing protein [Spartinivicinus marinus]
MKKSAAILAFLLYSHQAITETLYVCGHQSYAPFMWLEQNKIVGVGTDVAKVIFKEHGITINNDYRGPWKRCLANIKLGKTDLLVAAYKTTAREEYAVYSKVPLAKDANAIFVWKGKEFEFESIDNLKGKTVGRVIGGSLGEKIDSYFDQYLITERVRESHYNYMKLCKGRIDFFASGLYTAPIQLAKYGFLGKIVPLEKPLNTEYLYMAISKKSKYKDIMPMLESALEKLKAKGVVEKLVKKNIDYYISKNVQSNKTITDDCQVVQSP